MPCTDGGWPNEHPSIEMKKRLDTVTNLLCEVLGKIEVDHVDTRERIFTDEIQAWWDNHLKTDIERMLNEANDELMDLEFRAKQIEKLGGIVGDNLRYEIDSANAHVQRLAEKKRIICGGTR